MQDDGVAAGRVWVYTLPAGQKVRMNAVIHAVSPDKQRVGVMAVVQMLPCGVAVCYVVVCWQVA